LSVNNNDIHHTSAIVDQPPDATAIDYYRAKLQRRTKKQHQNAQNGSNDSNGTGDDHDEEGGVNYKSRINVIETNSLHVYHDIIIDGTSLYLVGPCIPPFLNSCRDTISSVTILRLSNASTYHCYRHGYGLMLT
jgi:hypothetical protein